MVNGTEQEIQSQRAFRQAQASTTNSTRSLSQLTGQPVIFAHIHLWFCWILNLKIATEKLEFPPELTYNTRSSSMLRAILQDMGEEMFNKLLYCYLTGISIDCQSSVMDHFKILLPNDWSSMINKNICQIIKENNSWTINWNGTLPNKLPTLHVQCMKALKDYRLPENALEFHTKALVFQLHNTVKSLCFHINYNKNLLQAMGIQNCDLPVLRFWMNRCITSPQKYQIIVTHLENILK